MKSKIAVVAIALSLIITGYYVNSVSLTESKQKETKLASALSESIEGWTLVEDHDLLEVVEKELKLDDFVNWTLTDGINKVSLYIGYYYSSGKVGAAHDPLVCFPGQGWQIGNLRKGTADDPVSGSEQLNYSSMIAELGDRKSLLLYWFQAFDETSGSTFGQKIKLAEKKLLGKGEDNAFVRISTSFKTQEEVADSEAILLDFVDKFYPPFLDFVISDLN